MKNALNRLGIYPPNPKTGKVTMQNKKKILYIITKSNFGGAQRYVFDLARSFSEKGYDCTVALGGTGKKGATLGALKTKLDEAGIKTIAVRHFLRDISLIHEPAVFWELFRIIKREKPDIIHVNSSKAGGLGALAARLCRVKKIVFTAHGWPFKEERQAYQKHIIYFLSWLTVLLCHRTIVVSRDDLEKAPALWVRNKLVLIHNGIGKIEYVDRDAARRSVYGNAQISEKNLAIGSIAELHRNKGLTYAVQALADIKKQSADANHPIVLGIIGEGEERGALAAEIAQKGLENSVFLAGYKDNAASLLSAFDLFLLPSLKEGLPYTLLEAGSVGLPVVATNVGGASDIITDMETGILIRPAEVKEISYALRFFVNNPDKIQEFGGKLKRRIAEEFSLPKMLENTISVYEK